VPLPSLEEQRFIVEEVEHRLSVVDKLEETVAANLKKAGGLRQSVLKRAFSGELVPQDPNDEPASVLLERIRAERQAAKLRAPAREVSCSPHTTTSRTTTSSTVTRNASSAMARFAALTSWTAW